jgi:hypothetical protein
MVLSVVGLDFHVVPVAMQICMAILISLPVSTQLKYK